MPRWICKLSWAKKCTTVVVEELEEGGGGEGREGEGRGRGRECLADTAASSPKK
jgi:hypothetical protein